MMSIQTLIQAAEYLDRRDREAEHGYASSLPIHEEYRTTNKRSKAKKSQGSRTSHNELEKNRRAHLRNCLEKLKDIVPLGPEASRHTTLGLLTKAKKYIKNLEEKDRRHGAYREQLARKQRHLQRRYEQLGGKQLYDQLASRQGDHVTFNHHHHHPSRKTQHGVVRQFNHLEPATTRQYMIEQEALNRPYLEQGSIRQYDQISTLAMQQIEQMNQLTQLSQRRSVSESSSSSASSGTASHCELPYSEPASISESDEVDVIGYTSNQSDSDDHSSVQSGSGDSGVALSASRLSLAHMEII